ncbi:MAG: AMP-binding protein, partial [Candidatus Aminicenantes bacterium]
SLHARPELSSPYVPPVNPVQQAMADMWQTFFGIEPIGIEDDFFQLGGDSLKAITILSKMHKELDIKLTIEEFFKQPVIKHLAAYILKEDTIEKSRYIPIEPAEKKEYYRLSSAQKRLYLVREMAPGNTGYNIPMVLPAARDINKDKLETIFKQLIARHESLRTSFTMVGNEPVQRIHETVDFEIEYYELAAKTREGTRNTVGTGQCPVPDLITHFIRPFDLSRAPLMRSGLVCLPDGSYTWMTDMHHIVSDGISQEVLFGDFIALYNGEELEPLPLQYKDFTGWQNRLFAGGGIKAQEDYWLNLYADAREIPRLDLPTDTGRPGVFTFAGDHYGFIFEGEDMVRFRELGTRNGATLFMSLLAVLNVLFYKYTGQADIIIGSGIAGRRHPDLQGIIGMFVNTLAMRNFPMGEKTFEAFLKEVSHNSLKAFENQDLQFEALVDRLDLERDPSRNPLFDICLVVQNFLEPIKNQPSPFLIDENLVTDGYKNPSSRFDMTFFIHELPKGIYIDIEFYTGIFTEGTIRRLVSHLNQLLKAIINDPFIQLKDIDMVSQEEKQQLLYEFNDMKTGYPKNKTIHELFAEQVAMTPDHMALVGKEEGRKGGWVEGKKEKVPLSNACGKEHLSYKELNERSNQLAVVLKEKGVQEDTIAGIMVKPSLEMIVGILGILKAGGAYMPIDPEYPRERIEFMLKDSNAKVFLASPETQVKVKAEAEENFRQPRGLSLQFINIETEFAPAFEHSLSTLTLTSTCQVSPTNLAYIIYTSGTTGRPKGSLIDHRNVVRLM